jgi:hypothetical protein
MRSLSLLTLLALTVGCNVGSEATFIGTSQLDTCVDEIPVCNTTAQCVMKEEDSYIEGEFPGQRAFIVPTEGEAIIRVRIFWRERLGPGADTEIIWYEPACVQDYNYESQGADVFADSNDEYVFTKEQRVFRAGEHLLELRSDATAKYLLRTEVLTKSEYEQEQKEEESPLGGGGPFGN